MKPESIKFLPKNNEEQREIIESMEGYSDLFHSCNFNNYTLNFIKKSLDIEQLINQKSKALRKLNVANYNLQLFCALCIKQYAGPQRIKDDLISLSNEWLRIIRTGNSFHTLNCAQRIINTLKSDDFPFIETLYSEKYIVIKKAFIELEEKYKTFYKVCLYVHEDDLYKILGKMLLILKDVPEAYSHIERIEIPKRLFGNIDLTKRSKFPAISITVLNQNLNFKKDLSDFDLIIYLKSLLKTYRPGNMNNEMSLKISEHINLYQGYRNYKHFLKLINSLDEVYDQKVNYALINN